MSRTRPVLLAAAREFNSGRYFEAHEALEDGLEEVDEADWDLVLGLIQIAVGYHKASQALWSGSLQLLEKGLAKTAAFPGEVATLRLDDVRAKVRADVDLIRRGAFAEVDLRRRPPRLTFASPARASPRRSRSSP